MSLFAKQEVRKIQLFNTGLIYLARILYFYVPLLDQSNHKPDLEVDR